ncbi:MAG TPA: bifunctional glutamate N-acetyltransferase/amino-acid acetyltransferase ArgJ [Gammaproteobacteria bacterium]|nr:bifunctional glutamate N-acetyltransferase/amino-acid acetyltransferase ArgJ [Gammaproteobacteria bacterium]
MAVGYQAPAELHPVAGVRLGTACAGIKYPDRRDLVVLELAPKSRCAAVFTRNAFCAAPVRVAREHLERASPRYLLINTGNANAGTGQAGLADARACCSALAHLAGCAEEAVLPFSTGVIGEPLPVAPLQAALPDALAALAEDGWAAAAQGILTTDTVPKAVSRRVDLDGHIVTLTGIAKGSGMIRPDMATMLAFVATDAALAPGLLQQALAEAVEGSFNRITVDGDTSTNDACVLVATGCSTHPPITDPGAPLDAFRAALNGLCEQLAQAIVRDGEGATKFVTVEVSGGRDSEECRRVAYTVAHSPLVKTALFAGDPNWGRILAAVGRAGVQALDVARVSILLDDVCIVREGGRAPEYRESRGQEVVGRDAFAIRIDLGRGAARDRVWTCDLSYDYVRINAEYRT